MSRKDFEALARIIAEADQFSPDAGLVPVGWLADRVADYLQTRNERFDRGKFMRAALPITQPRGVRG